MFDMATLGEMALVDFTPLVEDELTKKLLPKIAQIAERFGQIKAEGRFVLLRFHHDADGISGTFALSKVLRFSAYQQNSAAYTVKDAIRDLSNASNEERPVVVLLDFGLNNESIEGLRLLKAAGIELIVIDHHPPDPEALKVPDLVLSPWEFPDGDVSRYVAGYLCSEIAGRMGVDCSEYARIACAGDKSTLLEIGDWDRSAALVLDYLAANSGFGNNLRFYKKVLSEKELFDSMRQLADEKIEEAAKKAMRNMKENEGGRLKIVMVDLEPVVIKGEFPNRSKVTTRIFEKLNGEGPLVVLGLGERTIIIRINDAAAAKGASADRIAKHILEAMPDFAESGGGHVKAGAIRVKQGFVDSVVKEIIRSISS